MRKESMEFNFSYHKNSLDVAAPLAVKENWDSFCLKLGVVSARGELALDDYLQSSRDVKFNEKDGHAISLAIYGNIQNSRGSYRHDENVIAVSGIGLDIDEPGFTVDDIKDKLNHLVYFAHTTYSHHPDKPRWRIIIPYNAPLTNIAQHIEVANFFYDYMLKEGRHVIDRSCKNPSRIFFMPSCPWDAEQYFQCFSTEGKLLDPWTIKPKEIFYQELPTYISDDYVKRCIQILRELPITYQEWVDAGMAIHSKYPDQIGLDLFISLSQGVSYQPGDEQAAIRKWSGFAPDKGITIKTLGWLVKSKGGLEPELIDDEFLDNIKQYLSKKEEPTEEIEMPMPSEILFPPGILKDITEWINSSAAKPQPLFAIQSALALGSVVLSRHYKTQFNNYSSLYFMNVAKSGTGKEHAKTCIEKILEQSGHVDLIAGDGYTSAGAIYSMLLLKPSHITTIDEIGYYLQSANALGNHNKKESLSTLLQTFTRCDHVFRPANYSNMANKSQKQESNIIYRPAITLLGMTTPETLFESITISNIKDGFLNRFIIVEGSSERVTGGYPKDVKVPEHIINWVKSARPHNELSVADQNPYTEPSTKIIQFDEESINLLNSFDAELIQKMNELDEFNIAEILNRSKEIAMRISLICALAINPFTLTIDSKSTAWAISYVKYFHWKMAEIAKNTISVNTFDQLNKKIMGIIREAGKTGIGRNELTRKIQALRKRDREEVINTLLESEQIIAVPENKRIVYRAA